MRSILPDLVRRRQAAASGWAHGLGLRRRLLLSFAVGSLVLCSTAAAAAWWLSAGYLQSLRTRLATAESEVLPVELRPSPALTEPSPVEQSAVSSDCPGE